MPRSTNLHRSSRPSRKPVLYRRLGLAAVFVLVLLLLPNLPARAATFSTASVSLSDPRPNALSVNYTVTVSSVTATALRCIQETYVTTPGGATPVPGLSSSSATVSGSSTLLNGSTGTWNVADTANTVKYTNTTNVTAPSTTTGATFIAQNLTNGSTGNTGYWITFQTFSDSACATPVDSATLGFIYNNGSTLSLTVNDTLSFTVNAVAGSTACDGTTTTAASTATTIPFGTVTAAANGIVCQDLTAATNAANGYTIYARYTSKPTNALSQTINDWTGTNAAPSAFPAAGTEAYGYTTNDGTLGTGTANRFINPSQEWAAMTTSNAELAYESSGVNQTTYRVGHQVGVSLTTKPGTYTTTIIYTCTPIY